MPQTTRQNNKLDGKCMSSKSNKKANGMTNKIFNIIGAVLCVIFAFTLICNLTIIVKGTLKPDMPPSVLGTTPLVVLSGSMSGDAPDHIETGDLIFVDRVNDPETLREGDIIAFMQNSVTVTHRIVEIEKGEDGKLLFTTKGDANNAIDQSKVSEDQIVGKFRARIPKMGDFAIFLQTPLGLVLFIGIPLIAFIIYDVIRRQRYMQRQQKKNAKMEAELKRLRALAGEEEITAETKILTSQIVKEEPVGDEEKCVVQKDETEAILARSAEENIQTELKPEPQNLRMTAIIKARELAQKGVVPLAASLYKQAMEHDEYDDICKTAGRELMVFLMYSKKFDAAKIHILEVIADPRLPEDEKKWYERILRKLELEV